MPVEIHVPEFGESIAEATVGRWLKGEGDQVRIEATSDKLTITCYGVTGCEQHQKEPPVEDEVEIWLDG